MQVIKDIEKFDYDKESVVTVGTFDGVHQGHVKIIEKLNSIKDAKNLRSIVITFEPHPQIVLKNKAKEIKILTTLEEKLDILNQFNIDISYVINFTKEFANTPAREFYKNYLIDRIGLSDLVLGYDHMFGKNREGNFETLKDLSRKYNFAVDKVEEYKVDGEHISSTVIRNLLEKGDIKKVNHILGRYYSIEGEVVEGKKLGAHLGYPTANIKLTCNFKQVPKTGIYAVKVEVAGNEHFGMMSIGVNPSVTEDKTIKLEVNIFDFQENIYGKKIRVHFIDYIREEKKFATLDDLKEGISLDKEHSVKIINKLINKKNSI